MWECVVGCVVRCGEGGDKKRMRSEERERITMPGYRIPMCCDVGVCVWWWWVGCVVVLVVLEYVVVCVERCGEDRNKKRIAAEEREWIFNV